MKKLILLLISFLSLDLNTHAVLIDCSEIFEIPDETNSKNP
jgi:hypothetical protein